jgi:hypothetical protein
VSEPHHSDENRIFPPKITENSTETWKQERIKMRKYIVEHTVKEFSQEELVRIASQMINERYFYCPDKVLLSKYRSLGGK